ncbi:MAG: chemotaxis protein CheB [Myxococcota bacterium]
MQTPPAPTRAPVTVGIGASAGGLEALSEFFENVPEDTGMAFVVVQHLAADQKSHMADLLGRRTSLPVSFATDGMELSPNQVIVMPSSKHLDIQEGRIRLLRREQSGDYRDNLPIDTFFHSLAQDRPHRCVAVVLSGTGSDGTRGIRSVKEAGGLVIVQDWESAKFDGMPRSATSTGLADVILQPAEIPQYLVSYAQRAPTDVDERLIGDSEELTAMLEFLAGETGMDFGLYKRSTVVRRIQRRMAVTQISNLEQYDALLRRSSREAEFLRADLLIHVTSFFRDQPAWGGVQKRLPELMEACDKREGLRFWVTACSTGEEAYTLAMCVEQCFQDLGKRVPYKIFASDVDENAVDQASAGSYPASISGDLSPDLLARWFVKTGNRFVIARELRDRIIFAQHNLISDPPFAKMDMVTCRNMLIYLDPEVQQRVLRVIQFALRQGGLLMLGTSESLAQHIDSFDTLDSKWKLFKSRQRSLRLLGDSLMSDPLSSRRETAGPPRTNHGGRRDPKSQFINALQAELIQKSMPPTAIVDRNRALVQSFGDINEFLQLPLGTPSLDIIKMAEGELAMLLATAIRRVAGESDELIFDNVAYDRGTEERARVTVRRIESVAGSGPLVAIHFQKKGSNASQLDPELDLDETSRTRFSELERELQYTRESLQATVEELETTNEELQASNEELISSNEELQSTNEELQSVNEELHTMNGEFQAKIEELTLANDDFVNLMQTTAVGAIFLDEELRIRRFTDALRDIIGLVTGDVGRRIDDFNWRVRGRDISRVAKEVLDSGGEAAFAVHDGNNAWYWMRIRPYDAVKSHAQGVVITCVDITDEHRLERHYSDLATLSIGVAIPIVIVNVDGRVQYANRAFGDATGFESEVIIDHSVAEIVDAEVAQRIKTCITERESWDGIATCARSDESAFWATTRISPVEEGDAEVQLAVLTFEKIHSAPAGEEPAPAES